MKITAAMLRNANGPLLEVCRLRRKWPNGLLLNEDNLRQAIKDGFNIGGWMDLLLSSEIHSRFFIATMSRWDAYCDGDLTTRRHRNYLRSIIPDVLRAAKGMDKAGEGKK